MIFISLKKDFDYCIADASGGLHALAVFDLVSAEHSHLESIGGWANYFPDAVQQAEYLPLFMSMLNEILSLPPSYWAIFTADLLVYVLAPWPYQISGIP